MLPTDRGQTKDILMGSELIHDVCGTQINTHSFEHIKPARP